MRTNFYLIVFIFFSSLTCYGQNKQDSLRLLLQSHILSNYQKAEILQRIGSSYFRENTDSLFYYHHKAYQIGIELGEPKIYAFSAQMLGSYYRRKEDFDSAAYFNQIAEAQFRVARDSANLGKILIQQGNLLRATNQIEEAMSSFIEASKIFEGINNLKFQGYSISSIAMIKLGLKQYNEALEQYQEAYQILKKNNDIYGQSVVLNSIGTIYHTLDQHNEALLYYRQVLPLKVSLNDRNGLISLYNNIGAIYLEKKKYDSALIYLDKSGELMRQLNKKKGFITAIHNYAIIYRNTGKYQKSMEYLDSAKAMIEENGNLKLLESNYRHRCKLDSAMGNYKEAFANLKMHIKLRDSLSGNEIQTSIKEIETKYETEKKDLKIVALSQQNKIDELRIREQNFMIGGAILVIMLLVAGGYFYNQQKKLTLQNLIGEMEQKLLRAQMNPHFIFNALSSIQKYVLQQKPQQAAVYLAKFAKLMRQILEHSRLEFVLLEDEIDTLKNYMDIQKMRFGDHFEYEINIASDIDPLETHIPPMFAQPFIENSLEHGINEKNEGRITINFHKNNNTIEVEIEDNGKGLGDMSKSRQHRSLATQITRERLMIIGKRIRNQLELVIENKLINQEVKGTIVRLSIPFTET